MTVLIAVPYFRAGDFINEAVEHILAQTYRDFVCLVAGDGDEPHLHLRDDRLRCVSFSGNYGAPLTQQAMLLGSPFEWYAAHGADDWIEPDYLERLVALGGDANGTAALYEHQDETSWVTRDFVHVEFGVFNADLLRSVGGYGIDRRCGQDTLLYHDILPAFTDIRWSHEPRYHKRLRADSLTHSRETGLGSPYRDEVVVHNRMVAAQCERFGQRTAAIRAYRESLVPLPLRSVLAERVSQVERALG